jgi:AraC family transcriptional regulator
MAWQSYADFYLRSGYGGFPQVHRQSGGRLPFNLIQVDQGPHNFRDPAIGETVVALPLAVPGECNWRWTIDGRRYGDRARPGGMLLVPAEVESEWEVDGDRRLLILSVPHRTVRTVLGMVSPERIRNSFWTLAERIWVDPFVEALMLRLWEVSAQHETLRCTMSDGIVTTLLSHLLLRAGNAEEATRVSLAQWRVKRLDEFVDVHLGEPISLDQMAEVSGLSRRHFCRGFAAEVGITPHKWLMRRRLERAQHLLASSREPIAAIAHLCGFSSQSHLTRIMKQETGDTPLGWRRRNEGLTALSFAGRCPPTVDRSVREN